MMQIPLSPTPFAVHRIRTRNRAERGRAPRRAGRDETFLIERKEISP
jgi:hypothetical protein